MPTPSSPSSHHADVAAQTKPPTTQDDLKLENERLRAEIKYIREQFLSLRSQQQSDSSPQEMRSLYRADSEKMSSGDIESNAIRRRKDDSLLGLSPRKAMTANSNLFQQPILHHRHHKLSTGTDQWQPQDNNEESNIEHGLTQEDPSSISLMVPSGAPPISHHHSSLMSDSSNRTQFLYQVQDRAQWLVGLLVLQSMSSFIIARNEAMLQKHLVLVHFLTMLVGAGGNAGNQASVRVIRGLATGEITNINLRRYLLTELKMALILCCVLGVAGCIRTLLFFVPIPETVAITTSLCIIVLSSIILGMLLPIGMRSLNIDPAHSSTTIQVLMDILGVTITVFVGTAILDSPMREWMFGANGL